MSKMITSNTQNSSLQPAADPTALDLAQLELVSGGLFVPPEHPKSPPDMPICGTRQTPGPRLPSIS
jgi:hypothetical protein